MHQLTPTIIVKISVNFSKYWRCEKGMRFGDSLITQFLRIATLYVRFAKRLTCAHLINRSYLKGCGSTHGGVPVIRSAVNLPAPGPTPNPWPENPVAR